jgi:hypothetical protein
MRQILSRNLVATALAAALGAAAARAEGELKPEIEVTRRGMTLELDFRLVDAAGRAIRRVPDLSHRPEFTVHKNGRQVGSGTFEYG